MDSLKLAQSSTPRRETVVVAPAETGWTWSVLRRTDIVIKGAANDSASAWKTGAFAAGAVEAFDRLKQRRF